MTSAAPPHAGPTDRFRLALALAQLYLVWGSTYLAIRIAVESLPPLAMAGARFLVAGALLYAVARPRAARPTAREWRSAAVVGVLLLGGGNGLLCIAERVAPSGLAAIVIATVPLWVTVLPWLAGGARPRPRVLAGVALGFAGVAWLGWSPRAAGATPASIALLLVAALSWSLGSLASRALAQAPSLWLATGMQMICGGAVLSLAALAEPASGHAWATRSLVAYAYLVVAGSIFGFGSYVWLLRHATAAVATSYAYVNPLVAVVLGALLGGERVGWTIAAPAALILGAVALILVPGRRAVVAVPAPPVGE